MIGLRSRATLAASDDGPSLDERVARLDWGRIAANLDTDGFATTGPLLTRSECASLIDGYAQDGAFRSRVVMARHGFGRGEYRYFSYPLVPLVERLRQSVYPLLAPCANRWAERLRVGRASAQPIQWADREAFPASLDEMLARCHAAGQDRPTPLLLKYGAGDFNCLHQDIYGDHVFPYQLAILLSAANEDFTGGEFVLVEQRPRMQSKANVVSLEAGEGVLFAVNAHPVRGTRGFYRTTLRHGVSPVRSGERFTLGIIFHDAH